MQNNIEKLNEQREQVEALTSVLQKEVEYKEAVKRFLLASTGYCTHGVDSDVEAVRAMVPCYLGTDRPRVEIEIAESIK